MSLRSPAYDQTNGASTLRPPRRAVFAFALGCLVFGYAFLQRVAPSVMTEELMRAFSVGGAALGSVSAFYFYAYAGMQLPVGLLIDRFGPRRMMAGAMATCMIGSVLFATSESLAIAAIGRALIGGAVAFGYVGTMTIAAHWFPAGRFSLLVGILQAVGMTGAISGQAPLRLVVDGTGWRDAMIMVGALAALLALAIFLVVRDRQDMRKTSGGMLSGMGRMLRRADSWGNAVCGLTLSAPMLAFAGLWAVPWLVQVHGYSKAEAGATTSIIFIGWGISAPVYGWLTDRIGRRKPLLYSGYAFAVMGLVGVVYIPELSPPAISFLLALIGIGGCSMVLNFTLARETNSPSDTGVALSFVNMCVVGAGAIFQPLIGYLLDLGWDGTEIEGVRIYSEAAYRIAFSAMIVGYAIGLAACFFAVRETHCRQLVEDR
ncbi:MFS transporter [Marivibrio halodurans]|uniref:Lysosomal dipeptide transporter MFSD1 n=1 Tax=Marivibrio halodurans TaxID=2039722 RepID=A0A8J7V1P6_9PROT|nr:MFS transporter [Marivibrio halodurans]MBP5856032.1 MFS transporter [Marivibrio halodurans]